MEQERRSGEFSEATRQGVAERRSWVANNTAEDVARRVTELVWQHERWRGAMCLNLNAAEAVMSRGARALLASDLATRVTEGMPFDKEFPPRLQNRYVDEIEALLIALAQRLFKAEHVEWRPVSTSMANAIVYFALTKPGDRIIAQREAEGGNFSYNKIAAPSIAGLEVERLPVRGRAFETDLDATADLMRRTRPRMLILGGSNVLFPYPLRELRAVADEIDCLIMYDAAHLGLLIAAGLFQDPLREGADILTLSTHKIMCGAVGGLIFTQKDALIHAIRSLTFPTFMQTRDQNKYAATAHTLAELEAHGVAYARQIVRNSQALGAALAAEGLALIAQDRGYTQTHQIFVDLEGRDSGDFEDRCQRSNILLSKTRTLITAAGQPGGQGLRITTQEATRQGMVERDMAEVARFIRRAGVDKESPQKLARELAEFMRQFRRIRYSFDTQEPKGLDDPEGSLCEMT